MLDMHVHILNIESMKPPSPSIGATETWSQRAGDQKQIPHQMEDCSEQYSHEEHFSNIPMDR